MFQALMMMSVLMVSDTSVEEKTDTDPVVSQEEIKKLEEQQTRTSKYLFLGTVMSIVPGLIAFSSGVVTVVTGLLFIDSVVRLAYFEEQGKSAQYPADVAKYRAIAVVTGLVSNSCSIVTVISGVMAVGIFAAGMKAFLEDPDPDS